MAGVAGGVGVICIGSGNDGASEPVNSPAGASGKCIDFVGLAVGLCGDVGGASVAVEAPGSDSGDCSRQATNSSISEAAMRYLAILLRIVLKSFLLALW
jgi:hypothetical protein